jgi:hypothetical protein
MWKTGCLPSHIRNKIMTPSFSTSIKYFTGESIHRNKARNKNKQCTLEW